MMRTGMYGPHWTQGVLSEHVTEPTLTHDGTVFVFAEGALWPVLCSELVEIHTEDGTIVGRCGTPVDASDGFACAHHFRVIERARIEAELVEWEFL